MNGNNLLTHHKLVLSSDKSVIDDLHGIVYNLEDLEDENKLHLFLEKLLTGRSTGQLVNLVIPSIHCLYTTLNRNLVDMILSNARCVITPDGEYRWTHNIIL